MTYTIGVFASLFDGEGRILLVKQAYGDLRWTQPGGRLEEGELPTVGILREILEETGVEAEVTAFIGNYLALHKKDIVLHFEARAVRHGPWEPSDEISQYDWFSASELPLAIRANTRRRIEDGIRRRRSVLFVWSPDLQQDEVDPSIYRSSD